MNTFITFILIWGWKKWYKLLKSSHQNSWNCQFKKCWASSFLLFLNFWIGNDMGFYGSISTEWQEKMVWRPPGDGCRCYSERKFLAPRPPKVQTKTSLQEEYMYSQEYFQYFALWFLTILYAYTLLIILKSYGSLSKYNPRVFHSKFLNHWWGLTINFMLHRKKRRGKWDWHAKWSDA